MGSEAQHVPENIYRWNHLTHHQVDLRVCSKTFFPFSFCDLPCAQFVVVEPSLLQRDGSDQVTSFLIREVSNILELVVQQVDVQKEAKAERFRDPPPPPNFPIRCPVNPRLRYLISRINDGVFAKNGLHHIPYRDKPYTEDETLPEYDGKHWPDQKDFEAELLAMEAEEDDTIIDVFAKRDAQKEKVQTGVVHYEAVSKDALNKLIGSIKHPSELWLLPHILREWHRQKFPITLANAKRIAKLATKHNQVDVVLSMLNPQVFGLYFTMNGVLEVIRGMAKRASTLELQEGQQDFQPRKMLQYAPVLLSATASADVKRASGSAAVFGTILWGYVVRFRKDSNFRRSTSAADDILALAEETLTRLEDPLFGMPTLDDLRRNLNPEDAGYNVKYEAYDWLPVMYAFRQLLEILQSPYKRCLETLDKSKASPELISELKKAVHLSSWVERGGPGKLWKEFSGMLWEQVVEGKIKPNTFVESGQWEVFKACTNPVRQKGRPFPLRAAEGLKLIEKNINVWRTWLDDQGLRVISEFKLRPEDMKI